MLRQEWITATERFIWITRGKRETEFDYNEDEFDVWTGIGAHDKQTNCNAQHLRQIKSN